MRGRPRTAKKGEVEGLGSSQSGGTGQKVLISKGDGLIRTTRLPDDDDDGFGLFGNLGL